MLMKRRYDQSQDISSESTSQEERGERKRTRVDFGLDWLAFPGLQKLESLEATAVGHIMRESPQHERSTKGSFCLQPWSSGDLQACVECTRPLSQLSHSDLDTHVQQSGLTHALTALTVYLIHFVFLNSLSEGIMNCYVHLRQGQPVSESKGKDLSLLNVVHLTSLLPPPH